MHIISLRKGSIEQGKRLFEKLLYDNPRCPAAHTGFWACDMAYDMACDSCKYYSVN